MKKWIAILLTAAMLITCTSCNIGNLANAVSDTTSTGISDSSDTTSTGILDRIEDIEDGIVEAVSDAVSTGVSNAADNINREITRGTINGNVYYSDYSGVTFTKPDEWVYSSDEQIAEMMNIAQELLDTNSFQDMALQLSSVYDMAVTDIVTGTNINISYENLALSNSTDITEAEYADIVVEQINSLTTMNTEVVDQSTVTLSGNEYLRITCNSDYDGFIMTQVYYLRKIDSFMNSIIVTLVGDYTIADIEAMFS